jgi:hypothetical protein
MSELPALARPGAGSLLWPYRGLSFTEDQLASAGVMIALVSLSKMLCAFAVVHIQLSVHDLARLRVDIGLFAERGADGAEPPNSGIYSFGFARNVLR